MEVTFSGWHIGINSEVFFAAIMPATLATEKTSPFSILSSSISARVSGRIPIAPRATAILRVTFLSLTSTILARPCSSKWLNFLMIRLLSPLWLLCYRNRMEKKSHYRLIILGSGAAGLTAAIYAARANLEPLVIEGTQPGGQLTITTDVENYPGFPDGIMGPELMEAFKKQAVRFGTEVMFGEVTSVDLKQRPFKLVAGRNAFTCDALIIA